MLSDVPGVSEYVCIQNPFSERKFGEFPNELSPFSQGTNSSNLVLTWLFLKGSYDNVTKYLQAVVFTSAISPFTSLADMVTVIYLKYQ